MTEPRDANKKFQKELNAGTVALVLLSVLSQTKEPMYGYQIAKSIEARGKTESLVKQGSLYPVLRSLERGGFLESRVEPSSAGPPRRYYQLTATGRGTLVEWTDIWNTNRDFVDALLEGNNHVSRH